MEESMVRLLLPGAMVLGRQLDVETIAEPELRAQMQAHVSAMQAAWSIGSEHLVVLQDVEVISGTITAHSELLIVRRADIIGAFIGKTGISATLR